MRIFKSASNVKCIHAMQYLLYKHSPAHAISSYAIYNLQ
jgi:hypothetical protein